MKKLIILILFSSSILAQSVITIGANTTLTVDTNSDICADSKIINGTVTGSGTWCGTLPLPVELTSFTAASTISASGESSVILKWKTATEVNNYGFEVERSPVASSPSATGVHENWQKIAFVEGAGNSNSQKAYKFIDSEIEQSSGKIQYRLKQIDIDGNFEYSNVVEVKVNSALPSKFELSQNYPNPFNPATVIRYSIPSVAALSIVERQHVSLKIYDILGNEITTLVNENQKAGNYEVTFNGTNFASGVYFYKLQTSSGFIATKKLILMK